MCVYVYICAPRVVVVSDRHRRRRRRRHRPQPCAHRSHTHRFSTRSAVCCVRPHVTSSPSLLSRARASLRRLVVCVSVFVFDRKTLLFFLFSPVCTRFSILFRFSTGLCVLYPGSSFSAYRDTVYRRRVCDNSRVVCEFRVRLIDDPPAKTSVEHTTRAFRSIRHFFFFFFSVSLFPARENTLVSLRVPTLTV